LNPACAGAGIKTMPAKYGVAFVRTDLAWQPLARIEFEMMR
jgi:hypothetical protein